MSNRLLVGLWIAWLLGFVGLGSVVWIDPLLRVYVPKLLAWWGV